MSKPLEKIEECVSPTRISYACESGPVLAPTPAPIPAPAIEKKENSEVKETKENENPFVKNTDLFLLLNIPIGKPNRKKTSDKDPEYVTQPAQKGPICTYYAFKVHAMMQKNYLERQSMADRKALSKYRKAITNMDDTCKIISAIINEIKGNKDVKPYLDKSQEKDSTEKLKAYSLYEARLALLRNNPTLYSYWNLFIKFLDSYPKHQSKMSLSDYIKVYQHDLTMNAIKDFIKSLKLDPKVEFDKARKQRKETLLKTEFSILTAYLPDGDFDKLPIDIQGAIGNQVVHNLMVKVFDCQSFPWSPFDSIDVLMNVLKESKSPLLFEGFFGAYCYSKPEIVAGKIQHYTVKGWPKDSHISKDELSSKSGLESHKIAVIGLEKDPKGGSGWVYYVDPNNECDPKVGTRIIHKISYEQFRNNCVDNITHLASMLTKSFTLQSKKLEYGHCSRVKSSI